MLFRSTRRLGWQIASRLSFLSSETLCSLSLWSLYFLSCWSFHLLSSLLLLFLSSRWRRKLNCSWRGWCLNCSCYQPCLSIWLFYLSWWNWSWCSPDHYISWLSSLFYFLFLFNERRVSCFYCNSISCQSAIWSILFHFCSISSSSSIPCKSFRGGSTLQLWYLLSFWSRWCKSFLYLPFALKLRYGMRAAGEGGCLCAAVFFLCDDFVLGITKAGRVWGPAGRTIWAALRISRDWPVLGFWERLCSIDKF